MRVLVTGASGFVGSHVARKLLLKGYDVRVLLRESSSKKNVEDLDVDIAYGDLRQIDSLKKALIGCKGLFHVAASYSFWSPCPEEVYKTNIEGTLNIIEAAKAQGIERIVYTSSESTLKSFDGRDGYVLNDLDDVAGDYKKSKLLAEKEVVRLIGQGIPINIINPTTPIGPRDIKPTPTGKIVLDMLNGKMPAFVNTGLNIIDVEDVAEGHILAFENPDTSKRYLIGNKNLTLRQILDLIADTASLRPPKIQIPLGFAKTLAYIDEFISGKVLKRHPRIPLAAVKTASKFRFFDCGNPVSELGLQLTPVEESFKKSIDWFRENDYIDRTRQKN